MLLSCTIKRRDIASAASLVSDSTLRNAAIPEGFFVRPVYETGLSLRGVFISAEVNMISGKQCLLCVVLVAMVTTIHTLLCWHVSITLLIFTSAINELCQERYRRIQNIVIPLLNSSLQNFMKMHA